MSFVPGHLRLNLPATKGQAGAALVKTLQSCAEDWISVINRNVHQQPRARTPLGLLQFWRQITGELATIQDQLQGSEAVGTISKLSELDIAQHFELNKAIEKLAICREEAQENLACLTPLEEHATQVELGLEPAAHSICSLLEGLHQLWSKTAYFGREESLLPILEAVGGVFFLHAKRASLECLNEGGHDLVGTASSHEAIKHALAQWPNAYSAERDKIEAEGTALRWEFDRRRLFGNTT